MPYLNQLHFHQAKHIFLGVALCACLSSPAFAKASQATETFVKKAEISGEFEVGSSRLAQDKSQSPAVKDFAAMMIKDHTDASQKLREAAQKEGLSPENAPKLDDKHARQMKALEQAKTGDFDKTYIEQQMRAHQEAVALFKSYTKSRKESGPVKQFAIDTLPALEQHLKRVQELGKDNRGS